MSRDDDDDDETIAALAEALSAGEPPTFAWVLAHAPDGSLARAWAASADASAMLALAARAGADPDDFGRAAVAVVRCALREQRDVAAGEFPAQARPEVFRRLARLARLAARGPAARAAEVAEAGALARDLAFDRPTYNSLAFAVEDLLRALARRGAARTLDAVWTALEAGWLSAAGVRRYADAVRAHLAAPSLAALLAPSVRPNPRSGAARRARGRRTR